MEVPKCRNCGEQHWSRFCPVTGTSTVTPTITGVTKRVTIELPPTCPQCALYEAEIKRLKLALATKQIKWARLVPAAERMSQMRARRKERATPPRQQTVYIIAFVPIMACTIAFLVLYSSS
ncbi:hypothetical protein [Bradyrhizobium sp. McL0615]|uniref:hypothetical protein n=1 Tax=Bradyrhizobium sp. McL0615 TaxID=3415673 RepID=UPI003CF7CDAD